MIGRLDAEGLGRAIVRLHTEPEKVSVLPTEAGFDMQKQKGASQNELVGYVLPLKPDDTQHLMVFANGKMMVIEPALKNVSDDMKGVRVDGHRKRFSSNSLPIEYHVDPLDKIISGFGTLGDGTTVTHSNDNPQSAEQFDGFIDQAITVASARKAEKEQAVRNTTRSFVDKFDAFFKREEPGSKPPLGPTESPGNHPPTQEPPQPPQQS